MRRLFVYGTLRPGCRGSAAPRLGSGVRVVGLARTRGALFDLDGYPGLVCAGEETSWVHGELLDLGCTADRTLRGLDEYEGCAPGSPLPPEFERVVVEVVDAAGARGTAWAYLYRGPVEGRARIASGDWLCAGS